MTMKKQTVKIPSLNVRLRIWNNEIDLQFDTIKELARYLDLDMSKSTHTVALSVFTKQYPNCIHHQSDYNKGEEFLKDYNFERIKYNLLETYVYDKTHFNDYEYGWYGFHGTFGGMFMSDGFYNLYWINDGRKKPSGIYDRARVNTLKQIDKIQDVKFISGDYREVI